MEFDFEAERVFDYVGSLLKFHSACVVCRGFFLDCGCGGGTWKVYYIVFDFY